MVDDQVFFKNRREAGELLSSRITNLSSDAIIIALPRGGVIVGDELATRLDRPLDILAVKKIGHPLNPEYAIGAVTEYGSVVTNKKETEMLNENWLRGQVLLKEEEAEAQAKKFLDGKTHMKWQEKEIVITDDGLATGLTMFAAIEEIKKHNPNRIIVAVPVVPPEVADQMKDMVSDFVAVEVPELFLGAVGAYYDQFDQVTDGEVIKIMKKHERD